MFLSITVAMFCRVMLYGDRVITLQYAILHIVFWFELCIRGFDEGLFRRIPGRLRTACGSQKAERGLGLRAAGETAGRGYWQARHSS